MNKTGFSTAFPNVSILLEEKTWCVLEMLAVPWIEHGLFTKAQIDFPSVV